MVHNDPSRHSRKEYSSPLSKRFVANAACARGDSGFIVVAVLWILGILTTLISIYAIYVTRAAVSLSVNDDRVQAEALVSSAVELTAYQLNTADEKSRPTAGSFAFRMGRANVAVEFRSEAARIDLNAASKELLAGLFAAFGAQRADAEYYADRIIAWRSKDDGQNTEVGAYRTAGLSYAPRQASFVSTGELWLVMGLPPLLVERALPFVTVFSGQPDINIMDAPPEVVAALPGMSADRLTTILSERGIGPQNTQFLLGMLGPARAAAGIQGSKATRVSVGIRFDNGRRIGAEAVILPLQDGDEPFRVLSWRDDIDGPI